MAIRDNLGGGSSGAVLDTLEEIAANTESGKAAGALAVKELNESLGDVKFKFENDVFYFSSVGSDEWFVLLDNSGFYIIENGFKKFNYTNVAFSGSYSAITVEELSDSVKFSASYPQNGATIFESSIDTSRYKKLHINVKSNTVNNNGNATLGVSNSKTTNSRAKFISIPKGYVGELVLDLNDLSGIFYPVINLDASGPDISITTIINSMWLSK